MRRRVLVGRLVQVIAWTVIAVALGFLGLLLVDALYGLSVPVLRVGQAILLGGGVLALCVGSGLVFGRPPGHSSLARRLEARFPELEERVLTLAALPADQPPSPFLGAVVEETERRVALLDFRQAHSLVRARHLAQTAGALLLLLALPVLFWPPATRFAHRFLGAWSPTAFGYEILASPAGGYAALGRPLLLQAELKATLAGTRLPDRCVALLQDDAGSLRRLEMEPTSDHQFALAIERMPAYLSVRIEAGGLESDEIRLEGVRPVELLSAIPGWTVRLPPYAEAAPAAPDASPAAVRFGTALCRFHVNRPAVRSTFEWREGDRVRSLPVAWSADGLMGNIDAVLAHRGSAGGRLILEAEHGITTTIALPDLKVWDDPPPAFTAPLRIGGAAPTSALAKVSPEDPLRIETTVEDAVGLDRVMLEYRVNGGPSQVTLLESARGSRRVEGDWTVDLGDKVKTGDHLELRLQALDNRRLQAGQLRAKHGAEEAVPATEVEPQVTLEPAPGAGREWIAFRIEPKADPLEKQRLLAERDDLAQRLEAIRKDLKAERDALDKTLRASHGSSLWTPEQARGLTEVRKRNAGNQASLQALAQQAQAMRGLEPLARLGRDVAARELTQADDALRQAEPRDVPSTRRETVLRQADERLQAAQKRLEEMLKVNEVLAQERLRQWELESLAGREDDLARRAASLAKVDSPEADAERKKLMAQQEAIARQLEEWARKNPMLKDLAARAEQQKAKELAQRAQDLAMEQSKLSRAEARNLAEKLKKALAGVAVKQAELADRVGRLDRDVHLGIDSNEGNAPVKPARQAANHLREGEVEPALAQQETAAEGLDRLADRLDKLVILGTEARRRTAQLAELQAKLVEDLEKLGKEFAILPIDETLKRLAEGLQRQQQIRKAVEAVPVPPGASEAGKLRQAVLQSADTVLRAMTAKDLLTARDEMEKVRDALRRLATALPEVSEEQAAEREKLAEKVRKEGVVRSRALATEQRELRDEVRRLLAELLKEGSGGGAGHAELASEVEKLKNDLLELSQKMKGPEAQALAKESAKTAAEAAEAMKKGQEEMDKGKLADAAKSEDEASLKLELAGNAAAMAGEKAAQAMPKPGEEETRLAESFEAAKKMVNQAANPSQRPEVESMKNAAQALRQTAKLAGNQIQQRFPPPPGPPPSAAAGLDRGILPPTPTGQAWGDLPGELRTRVTQDLRRRYGEDYEAIIQRYFRNLAESPARK